MSLDSSIHINKSMTLKIEKTAKQSQIEPAYSTLKHTSTKFKTPTSNLKKSTLKSPGSQKNTIFNSTCRLPRPNIVLEDILVSQLSINDVINNCIVTNGGVLNLNGSNGSINKLNPLKPVLNQVYHRCYSNSAFNPIWLAFNSIDTKRDGRVSWSSLQPLILQISPFSLPDRNFLMKFNNRSEKISFNIFRSLVTDNIDKQRIDERLIAKACWSFCKHKYLQSPYVDVNQPVVPDRKNCSLFWVFCVFCRLCEPGIYPPVIDYEEAELLMRKMMCCLGVGWCNSDHTNDDTQSALTDDYESTKLLLVTFQQLLSIIPDMVGNNIIQSDSFYLATKWICLTEFCDVLKCDWMQARKIASVDHFKKRWVVLHRNSLICYSSKQDFRVKKEILFNSNMNIESLPPTHDKKFQFRIVEKDGDFSIKREEQFIVTSEKEVKDWVHLINMSIKLISTGMTAKYAEIAERRYERHRRRQSLKNVSVKRKDVRSVKDRLEKIRQERIELQATVDENRRKHRKKLEVLNEMNGVYEKLLEIHKDDFLQQNIKNEVLNKQFEETPSDEVTTICRLISEYDVRLNDEATVKRAVLEQQLDNLRRTQSSIPKPESYNFTDQNFNHTMELSKSDSCYDTLPSSESSR